MIPAIWRVVVSTSILFGGAFGSSTTRAQDSENALLAQLSAPQARSRSQALDEILRLGVRDAPEAVRAALIRALENEASLHQSHDSAVRQGVEAATLDDPELLGRLAKAVVELDDPRAIPALGAALGSGFTVIRGLANFGEDAAPAVLAAAEAEPNATSKMNHALITMRFMVEGVSRRPLSPATLREFVKVAAAMLDTRTKVSVTTRWWAIDLAAALKDQELRHTLELLSENWSEVEARGVVDPELVARTQERAAARLRGDLAQPRP